MSVLAGRLSPRETAGYVVANGSGQIKLSKEGVLNAAKLVCIISIIFHLYRKLRTIGNDTSVTCGRGHYSFHAL